MKRPERDELARVIHGLDPSGNTHPLSDAPCCATARTLANRVVQHYDVQIREAQSPQVCPKCHNFLDTPGHIYGCEGLNEAGVPPYTERLLP